MPEVGDSVFYTDDSGVTHGDVEVTHVHDPGNRSSLVDLSNGATGVTPGDPGTPNSYAEVPAENSGDSEPTGGEVNGEGDTPAQ